MNALFASGAKRNHLLAIVGLVVLVASPALLLWASSGPAHKGSGEESWIEEEMLRQDARMVGKMVRLTPIDRNPQTDLFQGAFAKPRLLENPGPDHILTSLGHLDINNPDELLRHIPGALGHRNGQVTRTDQGTLAEGLNYLTLGPGGVARGANKVHADIQALGGKILDYGANNTVTAYLPKEAVPQVAKMGSDFRFTMAVPPAMKLEPGVGRRQLVQESRAKSLNLLLDVVVVPGLDLKGVARTIRQMPGVDEVIENPFGSVLQVKAHHSAVRRILDESRVARVEETPEFGLANAEATVVVQAGAYDDARGIRPFDDAGVDGGGIDTNGDGARNNNPTSTDEVKPQIVGVIDNGISVDQPGFSHTATQASIPLIAPIGPNHRKVHALRSVNGQDPGLATCDSLLSGAGTHGNVVASTVAANPSQVGALFTRNDIAVPGGGTSGTPRDVALDGVARGARILFQDAASADRCTINELIEKGGEVSPGDLFARLSEMVCPIAGGAGACAGITGGGDDIHIAVLPFGTPNFSTTRTIPENGTYPTSAANIDRFLYNNRDFTVVVPVGNKGALLGTARNQNLRREVPDLFDGSASNDVDSNGNPLTPIAIQTSPPATAKNVVSVGSSRTDVVTLFGIGFDAEETLNNFSSRGPATPQSLRMAPIIVAAASDSHAIYSGPGTLGIAVMRSTDNDNSNPVVGQIDEFNFGGSLSAGYVAGSGALIRDYFAQGFYPTGSRNDADRVSNISGSLVKALLVASANFLDYSFATQGYDQQAEFTMRHARCANLGTVGDAQVGIHCNSEQGYGRVVVTQALPLANWPNGFILNPNGASSGATLENPAAGLIVHDYIATGEPLLNNSTTTSVSHLFTVDSPNRVTGAGGCQAIDGAQLRIAVAWTDVPSAAGSGGPLVNNLDLVVESPGPDNDLNTTADNIYYDGNHYGLNSQNALVDQWSLGRSATTSEIHDTKNPQEGVHLSSDMNADGSSSDSTLCTGTWRVTVKAGGTLTIGAATSEDANGNWRLDAGEDTNANGLLDLGGQGYSLAISGPVFLAEAAPPAGPSSFPASSISWGENRYGCDANASLTIFDSTPGAGVARSTSSTSFSVVDAAGNTLDTEQNMAFVAGSSAAITSAAGGVPVRLANPAIANNGVLEADTGQFIVANYAPAGQRAVSAKAQVRCSPDLVPNFFAVAAGNAFGPQVLLQQGCDNDDSFDAGETVTYGVAFTNRSRDTGFSDLVATLTPSGPGASAVRVLDSPRDMGALPAGQTNSAFFHVYVDPTAANGLSVADRKVTMTLSLESSSNGQIAGRQSYEFTHPINSDRETFHYSTDHPDGSNGTVARDLNRNLVIDEPDTIDPFRLLELPNEYLAFDSMFFVDPGLGVVSNTLGEDLDGDGILDPGEDLIPNGVLDPGILTSATPADQHLVPWDFDRNTGGWFGLRHPGSTPGGLAGNVWEYETGTVCGAQTSLGGVHGIWHTGDTNPATPTPQSQSCDQHAQPGNLATAPAAELIFDVLHSPIIAKVHQTPDTRGFPYTVEFQRFGANFTTQTQDAYAGGNINIDNNIDFDGENCFLCQQLDTYYARRFGGTGYSWFRFAGQAFPGTGINETGTTPRQRTFGPASAGAILPTTGSSNPNQSVDPLLEAPPDQLPYPLPGSPQPGVCVGGGTPGAACQADGECSGGSCVLGSDNLAGPVRNLEATLVGFEGGYSSVIDGTSENSGQGIPGPGGNRWQIGIGFYAIESAAQAVDYGFGVDDPVFEWDEYHPLDESLFGDGRSAACDRFGQPGEAVGGQCATITVDRTNLYDCDEALDITVVDTKIPGASSVEVAIVTESDSIQFSSLRFSVLRPNAKRYTLPAVQGQPGFFRGSVTVSSATNTPDNVFVSPGGDTNLIVYYDDPNCDGDVDQDLAENSFDDIDGDGVTAGDKCPLTYDPGQEDVDGDGVGNLCDNCQFVANPGQTDTNADGLGDACEFDDVDGDGVANPDDNCKDVYNPSQAPGQGGKGVACDAPNADRDGDGIVDRNDNCVLVANAQTDSDSDGLGDACDGDCEGAQEVLVCSEDGSTCATLGDPCGVAGICQTAVRHLAGSCSPNDDDGDGDGVPDDLDLCPSVFNAPIVPGTLRQSDIDRDGLGDACDPAGSNDDDFDGIPDDLVSFGLTVACNTQPLANFAILATTYLDIDGDLDIFPDTGEVGNVTVTAQNLGGPLSGVSFIMTSDDPDVECITQPQVVLGSIAAGETVELTGFQFKASDTLETTSGANAERVSLCLTAVANETLGVASALCFSLLADLDTPVGAIQVPVLGPDGLEGTADDGTLFEGFDIDKSKDGKINLEDTFLRPQAELDGGGLPTGVMNFVGDHGFYIQGSDTGATLNTAAAVACAGFDDETAGNPACILDPDFPFDWHFHCPTGTSLDANLTDGDNDGIPDTPGCPNEDVLPNGTARYDPNTQTYPGCVGGCSYQTPTAGTKALSTPNSMHMAAHFNLSDRVFDTTHFRALQAFVTPPINLKLLDVQPGDLEFSFFHIIDLMDNNSVNLPDGLCGDCADVQVQLDLNADTAIDEWGPWDKLVPFQNVYDHSPDNGTYGGYYCLWTPADTGSAPPAPRGVHETICSPLGAWSNCGSDIGTAPATVGDCAGPGTLDPSGTGVWVQSKFNLAGFLGQRVRIRWIGMSWLFSADASSYFEYGQGWEDDEQDDGWWLDNIQVTGVIQTPLTPEPDTAPPPDPPAATCPTTGCDESVGPDNGTNPVLAATNLDGDAIDGVTVLAQAGEPVRITAIDSTIPGGCINGAAQYQFFKNGAQVQDWSSKSFYQDSPAYDTDYSVKVRCSTDFACTSATGASLTLAVYSGDGGDIDLNADHTTASVELSWLARPQPPSMAGYDLFRGTIPPADPGLATLTALQCNISQQALIQAVDSDVPTVGTAFYYLAGHRSVTAGALTSLGRRSGGSVRSAGFVCTAP